VRADKHSLGGAGYPLSEARASRDTPRSCGSTGTVKDVRILHRIRDMSMGGVYRNRSGTGCRTRRSSLTSLFGKDKSGPKPLSDI